MTPTYDIFISYRHEENLWVAYALQSELESNGYSVFLDTQEGSVGENFPTELEEYVKKCKDFILILSEHTLEKCDPQSDWVFKEICIALINNKHIIPLTTEPFNWSAFIPVEIESIRNRNEFKYYPIEHVRILLLKLVRGLHSKPHKRYAKNLARVFLGVVLGCSFMYMVFSSKMSSIMSKNIEEQVVSASSQSATLERYEHTSKEMKTTFNQTPINDNKNTTERN